nr:MAG TPA: hypothetical protein [Caudoviricetes sp.]
MTVFTETILRAQKTRPKKSYGNTCHRPSPPTLIPDGGTLCERKS